MTKTKINSLKIYSLEEVEEDLKTLKPIRFKTLDFNPKTIKNVLDNLLINKAATYSVEGRIQCEGKRSRGVADMYRLCRYYFPEVTLKQVYKALRSRTIGCSFCYTTNQDVYNTSYNANYRSSPAKIRLSNRKAVRID